MIWLADMKSSFLSHLIIYREKIKTACVAASLSEEDDDFINRQSWLLENVVRDVLFILRIKALNLKDKDL